MVRVFEEVGWNMIKLPPRSPNLNAFAEHFVRSIKHECLSQLILIGEKSLHRAAWFIHSSSIPFLINLALRLIICRFD